MRSAAILFRNLITTTILALLAGASCYPQAAVGIQKFGTYEGTIDTIDVGSLGMNLQIPLWSKAGRGHGTSWSMVLTNYSQSGNPYPCFQASNGLYHCVHYGLSVAPGILATGQLVTWSNDGVVCNRVTGGTYSDYFDEYIDGSGGRHFFAGHSRVVYGNCPGYSSFGFTGQAADGSGYLLNANEFGNGTITTPSGTVYSNFSQTNGNTDVGAAFLMDSNGNSITVPSSCVTAVNNGSDLPCLLQDTLNTSSVQISGGTIAADYQSRQPVLITYLDDTGTSQTISLNYGLQSWGSGDALLLNKVTFPDGTAYSFTYNFDTPSSTLGPPWKLSSITLPSGGVISYTYSYATTTCGPNPNYWYVASLQRTTSDGTTTYARTPTSDCVSTSYTTITKPNGDKTVAYFIVPQHLAVGYNGRTITWQLDTAKTFETKRLVYDHSNLSTPLRTIMRCYNGATGDCTTTGINEPITQLAVTTTLDNGLSSQVVTQYTGLSLPTEVDEYDYGASSPTRKTITTYNTALTNNISDRPSSIIVYDSAGNVVKKTTYAYDETTPPPMTLPGHTTVSGSRGNATSVYHWLVSSNQSFRTQPAFDDAGQVTSITDPMGNVTSYSYDSATDAYRTKITRPTTNSVAHVSTFAYGPNSGLVTSAYDENNQLTSYAYDSMFRPSSTSYPDGGQTTFSYTPNSRTTKNLQKTGVWVSHLGQLDAYGRLSTTQLTSDPDCTSGDKVDTTYDALGRVHTVSNPYCSTSDPTYGLTTYAYDALDRPTSVTLPDGSITTTSYSGNTTTVTDPAGKSRKSLTDALDRLTQIFEDPGASPHLNYETDYAYDALDNLLSVNQKGGDANSANWRTRTFAYDSLSRLTSASNPESGTITYSYDANGNLLSKTSPAQNQTGTATVTVSYCYDTLNRMTAKAYTFSPNTPPTCSGTPPTFPSPTATFTYDVSSLDGYTNFTNTVGRLVRASATASYPAKTYYSYDSMGRSLYLAQCVTFNCGNYGTSPAWWTVANAYDLMGNLTSYTDGAGTTFTQTFDGAGRPSNLVDATHAVNLFSVDSSIGYFPHGALRKATFGNGLTMTNFYNNRLQPCRLGLNSSNSYFSSCTDRPPSSNVLDFTYGFNAGTSNNGNVASWTAVGQQTFTRSFGYDSLNRIANMSQSSGTANANGCGGVFALTWTDPTQGLNGIDAWGNRTDQWVTAGTCNAFHQPVNANNRFTTGSYDAAGNLLSDGLHSYSYDPENRIQYVDSGNTATYLYDAAGRRVGRQVGTGSNGVVTYYVYGADGQIISELNTNSQWLATFPRFGGKLIAQYVGTATYFYHQDHLGSTRLVTAYPWVSATQSVPENLDYLPFGEQLTGDNAIAFKFTGKERDSESGLDNFGARYDSSSLGRFMSPDPMYIEEQKMLDPQQLNLYSYVRNNPLNLTDSTGMLVDVDCQQVSAAQCSQTVTDFNNREGAQFQVSRDDKTGQLNVNGDVDPTKLSDSERALYDSITNKDATGTVTVVGNDSSFDFEKSTGKGQNSVDRSDLNALNSADKRLSGEIIAHAAIESYNSAKPGVSVDQAHELAAQSFGFKYGRFTPNFASQVNSLFLNFRSTRLDQDFRATLTLKTPIPMVTFRKMQTEGGVLNLPRDVTKVTLLP